MNSDDSDLDFNDFCTRIDKKKNNVAKKVEVKKKNQIGKRQARNEDKAITNFDNNISKHDNVNAIKSVSDQTLPYNVEQGGRQKQKKPKKQSAYIKKSRNARINVRLGILKEKAKQDYFYDLRAAYASHEIWNQDEMEQISMNLRQEYDELRDFLENESAKNKRRKSSTFTVDPSPRGKVKRVLSYSDELSALDSSRSRRQISPDLNMSSFKRGCTGQPQGTAMKKNINKTGIRFQSPECDPVTPLRKPKQDLTSGLTRRPPSAKVLKTPTGVPSILVTVAEVDEPTPSPSPPPQTRKDSKQTLNVPKRQMAASKLKRYKPKATSTPNPPCPISKEPNDSSLSTAKEIKRTVTKQPVAVPSTSDSEIPENEKPEKKFPKRTYTGITIKPKFKPITTHNLNLYKKRAQNEFTAKVTHAKRTIPVAQRTCVIDHLKKELDDKLKRIDKLPQLQNELDKKYADDVSKVTGQLHDSTNARNDELDLLKRNYDLRTAKLVEDFEVAELEEKAKARPKLKLKIPKHNLNEYRERANCDFKKKSEHAKKNIPVSERCAYIGNLQKELEKKLRRIDRIPEIAKNIELKYNEAVKNTENQFADDYELLQEQLEFLKEEYDAKLANLDEETVIETHLHAIEGNIPITTSKAFDCKALYNKIGPVLDIGELPKPPDDVITQKDQILANLKRARKANITKKQVLSATNRPSTSQKPPKRPIQETIKVDKNMARKQLMEAARARAKSLRKKLKAKPSEPLVPKLPPVVAANPLRKEGAEDIFHMMLVENEAIDMSKPPQEILEILMKTDVPKLEIVGNAFEMDDNEIVPVQIPTRDLNQLNQFQEQEIAATLQLKQHPTPADGLAAKILTEKKPIKIPLNKNPDYELISIPVYLNSYKYEDLFQVRGTTFPKWFPGFYSCGPHPDAPQIILRESPSEILQQAWFGMKPKRVF